MRLLVVLAGLVATPFAAWPAPGAATRSSVTAAARPQQTDAQIESTIKAKLAKSKIGADGFKARVQGGIVYWEGTTNVIQHKGAATRMAKTSGARAVVNNIKIGESGQRGAERNTEVRRAVVGKR